MSELPKLPAADKRLMSLDALRGANMFFIMGGAGLFSALAAFWPDSAVWQWIASQMHHVDWHGFAQHDSIFPTFLFIAGVAFPFSFAKQKERGRSNCRIIGKLIYRAIALVILGILVNNAVNFDWPNLRYASVLGHIGLAWMAAGFLYMMFGCKTRFSILAVILIGYWLLLKNVAAPDAPEGASSYSFEGCLVGYIDRLYLPGSLHQGTFDPEGILSLIPAIGTALLGTLAGDWLRKDGVESNGHKKALYLLIAGLAVFFLGWLWNYDFPVNKKLWTSSFVCVAGGYGMTFLAVFYWIIDVVGLRKWAFFFVVIGMNSITIYLLQRIVPVGQITEFFTAQPISMLPEQWQALAGSIAYILTCWFILLFLYRKKIFLRV